MFRGLGLVLRSALGLAWRALAVLDGGLREFWGFFMDSRFGWLSKLGSLLGTLNNRCRIIIATQQGTLILTTTHIITNGHLVWGSL